MHHPPSPYLVSEARFIALSRALSVLHAVRLEDPAARRRAYAARDLIADAAEDAEALRRILTYWRQFRVEPAHPAGHLWAVPA